MELDYCVFCNLAQHTVPAEIHTEDDDVLVVRDILPKAPVHMLVIAKRHIASVTDLTPADQTLAGKMILAGQRVAADMGIAATGYKLIFNVGKDGGQIVPHLHLHVLGGTKLGE